VLPFAFPSRRTRVPFWRATRALAAAACIVLAMLPGPVAAASLHAVPVDAPEFQDLRSFLRSLGMTDQQIADVAASTDADRLADWVRPDGSPSTLRPAATDIATSTFFEIEATMEVANQWRATGGPLAKGSPGVALPARAAGRPAESEFYVYATTTADRPAPQPGLRIEGGLAAFDSTPPGGGQATRSPSRYAADFFAGMNVAWSVRSESGAAFAVLHFQLRGGAWIESGTDAIATVVGRTLVVFIPGSEFEGLVEGRAFGFTGSQNEPVIDVWPEQKAPAKPYAGSPIIEITTVPAVATPTSVTGATPAASQTVATGATPGASSSPATAATPPAGSATPGSGSPGTADNSLLFAILVVVGAGVVVIGGLVLTGRLGPGGASRTPPPPPPSPPAAPPPGPPA
jgi:hypothetical protein